MAANPTDDLYELLGVSPGATDEQIKSAYRKRARELHPDANGGDPESEARFKEVSIAYEVLRDPERRARYDRYGAQGVFGQGAATGGFDFEGGLGDLFDDEKARNGADLSGLGVERNAEVPRRTEAFAGRCQQGSLYRIEKELAFDAALLFHII